MAQSLVKLTLDSNQYEKNLRQAKKNLDDFTKQIGINTKALSGVAVAAGAVTGAMKVMKDAFMASEKMVDEWGRTVESVKSVYEGFLNGLNNSDISGFLGRIDQIVTAARNAYDAIDNLGTLRTIQSPLIAKRQAENDRLKTMLQTGRYIAPAEGSGLKATMATGTLLSDSQKRSIERMLENGTKEMVRLVANETKATGNVIDELYNRFGAELGMSVDEFRKGTSSWEEFTKRLEGAKNYSAWQSEKSSTYVGVGGVLAVQGGGKNPFSQYKGWDKFRVDGERYAEVVRYLERQEQLKSQRYSLQGQSYRTINRVEGITSRIGGGKSGSGKAKETYAEGSIAAQKALIAELTKQYENAGASTRDGIKKELDEANKILQQMIQGTRQYLTMDFSSIKGTPLFGPKNEDLNKIVSNMSLRSPLEKMTEDLQKLTDEMNSSLDSDTYKARRKKVEAQEKKIEKFKGTDKGDVKQEVGNLLGGVNSIVSGIEQIGIEIPQEMQNMIGVLNGIFTVVEGISAAVTAIEFLSGLPLARGGIVHAAGGVFVPGNSYSGDRVPALLNSGELVLNKAQQGNLASQLEGGALGNLRLTATISGEQIRLALNNNGRRTGRGEMITAKFGG